MIFTPLVSVVIGSYQRRKFLEATIESIRLDLTDIDHEIIVVDGGSSDGSLAWLERQKDVILILQHNRGVWRRKQITRRSWGYFMNLGFKVAQGKYICMLSDDCLVVPMAIKNGIETFEQATAEGKRIGSVAFYWRNWSQQDQYMVGLTMGHMYVNHGLYLNDALKDVGYIDETNYRFYHADGDLCLRMSKKGWDCIDSKHSFIEHFPEANLKVRQTNNAGSQADWDFYVSRWGQIEPKSCFANCGDWIYKSHFDKNQTYRAFPSQSRFFLTFSKKIKRLAKGILKLLF
jgi:GT2 family glycosyltransferase